MKQVSLILLFSALLGFSAFAQNNLHHLVVDSAGNIKHYVTLAPADQVAFDEAQLTALLGLQPNITLKRVHIDEDKLGYTHYRYRQHYLGIQVENTMYTVHVKDGRITQLTGDIIPDFGKVEVGAAVAARTPEAATSIAKDQIIAAASSDVGEITSRESPVLVWYPVSNPLPHTLLHLAYRIDIYAKSPLISSYLYVDALSGEILASRNRLCASDATGTAATGYSGSVTIHSDLVSGSYRLHDYSRGNGIITQVFGGADYTSSTANWTLTGLDQFALDAHFGAAASYDFYLNTFGRNGIDGAGMAMLNFMNETYYDNAYWTGTEMVYGRVSGSVAKGMTGIDVCGHELTHGVTQYTCDLIYQGESGAINESLSDIMGKSIQFYAKPNDVNWKLSNDMNLNFRDLSNPNSYLQPDTYLGTNWYTGSNDNGGVHYNSGLGNFMFYLLVNGGKGTNDIGNDYSVVAIGLSKAQQIIYRSQSVYLFTSSDYADWRIACINAATDLYGATSTEVTQVKNAFHAVGIGGAGSIPAPNTCNPPGSLSVSNITASSVSINWASVSGANLYYIQYKPTASSVWTTVTALSVSVSKTISGLAWGTNYDFRMQTKCLGGYSAYSATQTFSTSYTGAIYCNSHGNYPGVMEFIDYVNISTLSRTSGADAGGYYNAASMIANVNKGTSYTLTFSAGFVGNTEETNLAENWAVYIDWNLDHDFSDAGETAALFLSTDGGYNTVSIPVPYNAVTGSTLMRIAMCSGASPTPCGAYDTGEIEDYTLNVQTPVCTETFEPNNTKNTAKTVVTDADILSQISTSTDEDWFAFNNTTLSSNMKVKVFNLPANYNLKVYDNNGNLLVESKKGGTTNEAAIWNTPAVGTYKARVFGKDGAFSNTQCYTFKVLTSGTPFKLNMEEPISSAQVTINLYPNPAATILNGRIEGAAKEINVYLKDITGKVLKTQQLNGENETFQMEVAAFPPGVYLLEAAGEGWHQVKRVELLH